LVLPKYRRKPSSIKKLVGVDLFIHSTIENPDDLAASVQNLAFDEIKLKMITNRGIKVWPNGFPETFCTDHWRCRFQPTGSEEMQQSAIVALLQKALESNLEVIKTENLYSFDGKDGFSLGQGQ
jgi:isocitrate dehydrogenase